jgi:hypothetical protein
MSIPGRRNLRIRIVARDPGLCQFCGRAEPSAHVSSGFDVDCPRLMARRKAEVAAEHGAGGYARSAPAADSSRWP